MILRPILSIPTVLEVSSKDNSENTSDSGIKISLIKETTEGSLLIGGSVNKL